MRPLTPHDAPALLALQQACYAADGYYAIPLEWNFEHAITESVATRGINNHDDQLIAAAWLKESGGILHLRMLAHPDYRAFEPTLLEWAESTAREHHATILRIHDQALTDSADALYTSHGFTRIFAEDVLCFALRDFDSPRHDANAEGSENALDIRIWSPETAPQFYAAYRSAFSTRPNFNPPSQDEWIADHQDDEDFRADLSYLALENDAPLGFVVSVVSTTRNVWGKRGGWIDQVGVIPSARGKNLATCLIFQAMNGMQDVDHVLLHVNVNNPAALRLYRHLGFKAVGRRARYEKALT